MTPTRLRLRPRSTINGSRVCISPCEVWATKRALISSWVRKVMLVTACTTNLACTLSDVSSTASPPTSASTPPGASTTSKLPPTLPMFTGPETWITFPSPVIHQPLLPHHKGREAHFLLGALQTALLHDHLQ